MKYIVQREIESKQLAIQVLPFFVCKCQTSIGIFTAQYSDGMLYSEQMHLVNYCIYNLCTSLHLSLFSLKHHDCTDVIS